MWSSAMASSSPVVTPGRTAARTAAIAPATTSPAPRMSSISCGVLIWIIRPLHFANSARGERRPALSRTASAPERLERSLGDLLDRADGVDPGQQSLFVVPARQRRRLFPVHLEAVPHGLGLVVVALHRLAVDHHPPSGEPADQLVLVDDQLQDPVQRVPQVRERVVEPLALLDVAREPVEEEALRGIRLVEPVPDH